MNKSMFIFLFVIGTSSLSKADQLYVLKGNVLTPVSQVEAVLHLARNEGGAVLKCKEQKLNDKAQVRSVK